MNNTSAANTSLKNATDSSVFLLSKAEGISVCNAFILTSVLIFVGNLLTVVLFAVNKTLRKKSLYLVINMAFADLLQGTFILPLYMYAEVGAYYQLWTGGWTRPLALFYMFVDIISSQASLISAAFISGERFYAIYWPFRHRTLSMRAYRIVIFVVWTLALPIAAVWTTLFQSKHALYIWSSYSIILILTVCCCNIGIWRKIQNGIFASKQQNRSSRSKRATKTLLFVSALNSLSWLPQVIMNILIGILHVPIPVHFYYMVYVAVCCNSFVNPVVYALRIPEFKKALTLCCFGRQAARNYEEGERRNDAAATMTSVTQLRTLRADPSHINLALEPEFMDTKL